MANLSIRYHVQLTDVNGDTAVCSFPSTASDTLGDTDLNALTTIMGTFATDVGACSNAKVTQQSIEILVDKAQLIIGSSPPSDNKYPSVTDGARFQFANSQGERTALTVPAPLEAVFGAGSLIVDPTSTPQSTLIAFIQAHAEDVGENLYNLYKGGIKVGRRARRRRSALRP